MRCYERVRVAAISKIKAHTSEGVETMMTATQDVEHENLATFLAFSPPITMVA